MCEWVYKYVLAYSHIRQYSKPCILHLKSVLGCRLPGTAEKCIGAPPGLLRQLARTHPYQSSMLGQHINFLLAYMQLQASRGTSECSRRKAWQVLQGAPDTSASKPLVSSVWTGKGRHDLDWCHSFTSMVAANVHVHAAFLQPQPECDGACAQMSMRRVSVPRHICAAIPSPGAMSRQFALGHTGAVFFGANVTKAQPLRVAGPDPPSDACIPYQYQQHILEL